MQAFRFQPCGVSPVGRGKDKPQGLLYMNEIRKFKRLWKNYMVNIKLYYKNASVTTDNSTTIFSLIILRSAFVWLSHLDQFAGWIVRGPVRLS